MGDFLTIFFSISLKIFIGLFVLIFITGTFRRLFMNKTIKAHLELPDAKREKLIRVYQRVIAMWRLLFWVAPLYLLVIPVSMLVFPSYIFLPTTVRDSFDQLFLPLTTIMIGLYIIILDDFFYKKNLLKAIDKLTEREAQ